MKITRLALALVFLIPAGVQAGNNDTGWTNRLEQIVLYEGDSAGTTCHDVYIDGSNIYQSVNFNGQGLKLKFGASDGIPERPGYIRFENILHRIPAGAFIVETILRLTANAPSTGVGNLKVATRGNYTFDEATTTYTSLPYGNNRSIAGGGASDQIWAARFDATLASNSIVNVDITPAMRAWLDNYRNGSHGWTNQGVAMNINPAGSSVPGGTVSFFDSEAADTNTRPKLIVTYLPMESGYTACLYQPTATNTDQVRTTTVEDSFIWRNNQNQGIQNLYTNNYGAQLGTMAPTTLDPSSMLFRWTALQLPRWKRMVDAKLRFGGTDGFSSANGQIVNLDIRKCLRPWVEGTGTTAKASFEGVTFTNYHAISSDYSLNKWDVAGGTGAADSTSMFPVTGYGLSQGELLIADTNGVFAAMVSDWFDGDTSTSLIIRGNNASRVALFFANLGGGHLDPYQSPGLFVVFKSSIAVGTVVLLQ